MNAKTLKHLLGALCLGFAVFSLGFYMGRQSAAEPAAPGGGEVTPGPLPTDGVVAYYFIGNQRCTSCKQIERMAGEVLAERFAEAMADGRLLYRVVNIETPGQEHYLDDYNCIKNSLVLVSFRDGQQVEFENLDRVWELLQAPEQFNEYVAGATGEKLNLVDKETP